MCTRGGKPGERCASLRLAWSAVIARSNRYTALIRLRYCGNRARFCRCGSMERRNRHPGKSACEGIGAMRIGAVSYLNSKPLIEDLADLLVPDEMVLDYPSRLADGLGSGALAAALVPSVVCLTHPEYQVLSDACVAARGPVMSVKMYSRVPPQQIRSLALDEGSRTSSLLVQILLAMRYEVRPVLQPLPLEGLPHDSSCDAVLLIGDRAMRPLDGAFACVWDLGEEWYRETGLPFVFAVWAASPDVSQAAAARWTSAFEEARRRGEARVAAIARREAARMGLSESLVRRYLTEFLHFRLGDRERAGLEEFFRLAREFSLVPGQVPL
ncbi:MAG: hypothetical protein D6725_00935 [Planctomycetota bacterium]|nr:MAG: hypothetical protein D6725_00935 [Planctomycetota bacterium]